MGDRLLRKEAPKRAQRYEVRLAATIEEVRAAQTLRFLVFNVERNEGIESSYFTCRDEDPFDAICDHLIVVECGGGEIVGTYRLQTGAMARAGLGFYSAQEFDFTPLSPIQEQIVELGRACVRKDHRNMAVLGLLLRGIADYARARGGRYLLGCSSVPSTDPEDGHAAHDYLAAHYPAPPEFRVSPLQPLPPRLGPVSGRPLRIPRLITTYLSFGARICGEPSLDAEFKTIDFLTILDLDRLPASTLQRLGW